MKKIIKPNRDILFYLYIKKNHTVKALAKNFMVSQSTIKRWLGKDKIFKTKNSCKILDFLYWLFS